MAVHYKGHSLEPDVSYLPTLKKKKSVSSEEHNKIQGLYNIYHSWMDTTQNTKYMKKKNVSQKAVNGDWPWKNSVTEISRQEF